MIDTTRLSNRWRVAAPALAATSALARRLPAVAQEQNRPLVTDLLSPFGPMLALVPSSIAGDDNPQMATFADIARQLAAGGIEPPASVEDKAGMTPWIHASYPLAISEPLRSRALTLTRDLLGFDITDIDQTLDAGLPPNMVTLLRGRFDEQAVAFAWEANGYAMREAAGIPVASLFEDAQLDLTNEISKIALARMNNAAFLPDGTLAYAATLPLLESVIATATGAHGPTASLGAREDVTALLASLETPVVSAILFDGTAVSVTAQMPVELIADDPSLLEEIEAQLSEPMPPVARGLVGITAGGPTLLDEDEPRIDLPPATIVYRLLMATPGTAETAARVVDSRLASMQSVRTQQPWTDLFESWDARAVAGGDVLALDLIPADRPVTIWPQLLFSRDLLFLAW